MSAQGLSGPNGRGEGRLLSQLDAVRERALRRGYGKSGLVLKQFLPHKLFCFL